MTSKSSLVYCYRCSCACTYVGKTVQNLSERIKQHIPPKLLLPGVDLRRKSADSAITRHLKENSACLDKLRKDAAAERFSVLCQARSRSALDVLEALFLFTSWHLNCEPERACSCFNALLVISSIMCFVFQLARLV